MTTDLFNQATAGVMVGEAPKIDRIGNEGAIFTGDDAERSCTAGPNPFFAEGAPVSGGEASWCGR